MECPVLQCENHIPFSVIRPFRLLIPTHRRLLTGSTVVSSGSKSVGHFSSLHEANLINDAYKWVNGGRISFASHLSHYNLYCFVLRT